MLILTRKVGQRLTVGDDVTLTIIGVKDARVRIGINAPRDVVVHRKEFCERVNRELHSVHLP